jgi:hypothetical protein
MAFLKRTICILFALCILSFTTTGLLAKDYLCGEGTFIDGSKSDSFVLSIKGNKALVKDKISTKQYQEIPFGWDYKLFKNAHFQTLLVVAIRKDDPTLANYTWIRGDPYEAKRNWVKWGNCKQVG